MQNPAINVEEEIDRVVGRRLKPPNPLSQTDRKADAIAWREVFGGVRVPRGVYRFYSHQEAEEWLWRMISRPKRS